MMSALGEVVAGSLTDIVVLSVLIVKDLSVVVKASCLVCSCALYWGCGIKAVAVLVNWISSALCLPAEAAAASSILKTH